MLTWWTSGSRRRRWSGAGAKWRQRRFRGLRRNSRWARRRLGTRACPAAAREVDITSFPKPIAENDSDNRYKPGPDFEEDNRAPVLPISLSDSKELWLIQWPFNKLQLADFHGKEISLKLHKDGKIGSFENSSGKSYELVSFAAQVPDVTVFLPSSSGSKVVGKISRRVSFVRYPEPGDFDKPNLFGLKPEDLKRRMAHFCPLSAKRCRNILPP